MATTGFQSAGTLSAGLVWGSDSCSTPDPLPSVLSTTTGYYNGAATTGSEGQGHAICDYAGTTLIENDVWFVWVAPYTGTAIAYACSGGTGLDPKLAVHEGSDCPGTAPLECSETDGCTGNFDSGAWVAFETHAGQPYLIQIGSSPGTATGTGSLNVTMTSPPQGWVYQNDWTPFAFGGVTHPAAQSIAWMQRFQAKADSDGIVSVSAAFGYPGASVPLVDGDPATVAIWSDPDQDGKPHDAQLLASMATVVQQANTGNYVEIPLPAAVHVDGKFFVGISAAISPGQFPAVFSDSGWQGFDVSNKGWVVANTTGPVDLACLSCNDTPVVPMGGLTQNAHLMIRAKGGGSYDSFCHGSFAACPCNNVGGFGEGCRNSGIAGALLWGTGSPQVTTDDLVLRAMHFPQGGTVAVAVAGPQQQIAGLPFHAGLLCVSGQIHRYPAQFAVDQLAQGSVVALSNGKITAGSTWYFQVWYRDSQSQCGPSNLTNGLQVDFTP